MEILFERITQLSGWRWRAVPTLYFNELMKDKDDPSDPFSPLVEHNMHVERLSRQWNESQQAFAVFGTVRVQLTKLALKAISKSVKFFLNINYLKAWPLAKLKSK